MSIDSQKKSELTYQEKTTDAATRAEQLSQAIHILQEQPLKPGESEVVKKGVLRGMRMDLRNLGRPRVV